VDYYRRFPGDYAKDTRHLTLEQHGAYTLLLDHYYSTEEPILSVEAAQKICAAMSKRERNAVNFVLENFFEFTADGYRHSRVEKEIKYADSISKVRRHAAEMKHQKAANVVQMQSNCPAIPDNQTTRQPKEEKEKSITAAQPAAGSANFEIFWEQYPLKRGKQQTRAEWVRHGLEGRAGDVLASLRAWKGTREWREGFVVWPERWIRKGLWKEMPRAGPEAEKKQSLEEQLKQLEGRSGSGVKAVAN
jgi:uncharacterized protein YdaU (DUF1376 family)